MTTPSFEDLARALSDPSAFEREFGALYQAVRVDAERKAGISSMSRLWLLLAPEWTPSLAAACNFPVEDGRPVEIVLAAMADQALCECSHRGDERVYYIRDAARPEHALELERRGLLLADSAVQAAAIAGAMLRNDELLSPGTRTWAALARLAADRHALYRAFQAELRERLPRSSLAAASLDPLSRLRHAGRLLAFVDSRLSFLAANIELRIELELRQEDDRRRLQRFVEPRAGIAAFDHLFDPTNDKEWALHLIGQGGVGKSMLIRHLRGKRTQDLGGISATLDFDLLHPDYPEREPWLVLERFADQLRLHGGDSSPNFGRFDERRLALRARALSDPAMPTRDEDFANLFHTFSEAVLTLRVVTPADPDGVPPRWVVLFFDTCEELDKFHARDDFPPNLQATFRLAEALKSRIPHLRVVFAGRRLLAGAGAGWSSEQERPNWPGRPYLQRHDLLGLTRLEADELIARHRDEHSGQLLDAALVAAILDACKRGDHYNPFELDVFLAWAHDDPDLSVGSLRESSTDHYIEFRILRRLTEPGLRGSMPAVALLQQFDRATLRLVLGDPGDEPFDALWIALGRQEWISPAGDLLVGNPGICARICRWLQRNEPADFEATRARLQRTLAKWTLEQPLPELTSERCMAVIRTCAPDGPAALDWWTTLEARLAATDRLDTLDLFSAAGLASVRDKRSALALALRMTREALDLRHGVLGSSALIEFLLLRNELESITLLSVRARLARLDAADQAPLERALADAIEALRGPSDARRPLLLGAVLAALEWFANDVETNGREPPTDAVMAAFDAGLTADPPGARAFLQGLWARFKGARGDGRGAREMFERALLGASAGEVGRGHVEWRPPGNLALRLAAECVRTLHPRELDAADALRLLQPHAADAQKVLANDGHDDDVVDADRLLALHMALSAALATTIPVSVPPHRFVGHVRRALQRNVPDTGVSFAEALAAGGQVSWALDVLETRRAASESRALDALHAHRYEQSILQIVLAWRLFDDERPLPTPSSRKSLRDALVIKSLTRPLTADHRKSSKIHDDWWRSVGPAPDTSLIPHLRAAVEGCADPSLRLEFSLDLQEALILEGRTERVLIAIPAPLDDPELQLRRQLRVAALLDVPPTELPTKRLGRRRAAAIALDEGTLLALRLPEQAQAILQTSFELYAAVDDPFGQLFAATQLLMAAVRSRGDVPRHFEALRQAYLIISSPPWLPTFIPPWEALNTRLGAALRDLDSKIAFWCPWLARIVASIIAVAYPAEERGGEAVQELLRAIGRQSLPTEIDLLFQRRTGGGPDRSLGVTRGTQGDNPATLLEIVAAQLPNTYRWATPDGAATVTVEPGKRLRFAGHDPILHALVRAGRPVELRLGPDTHAVPWEELLLGSRLTACRVVHDRREFAPNTSDLRTVVIWSLDRAVAALLHNAWSTPPDPVAIMDVTSPDGRLPAPVRADVFHIVGEPVDIGGDVRLRLESSGGQSSPREEHGALIHPNVLAERLLAVRVCILQGSPILSGRRGRLEREDAGLLRRFGAALARVVPHVVVIPALGFGALTNFMPSVPRCLLPRPCFTGISALCEGIAELRRDLAADVCVYVPSAHALDDPRRARAPIPSMRPAPLEDPGEARFVFNGIRARSGEYLVPPMSPEEVVQLANLLQSSEPAVSLTAEAETEADLLAEARFLSERKLQVSFSLEESVDAKNLAQAGWGVIFAHDEDPAVIEALGPLLALRKQQASRIADNRYREFSRVDGYRSGETKMRFLARHGAGPGPSDPDRVPYYLLIVGSPEKIPFEFQAHLNLQYAVGRLHFDTLDEYATYARSVVAVEQRGIRRQRRLCLFGVTNLDDPFTARSEATLIRELADDIYSHEFPGWSVEVNTAESATKARLARVLDGPDTPAVLLTAGHGVGFIDGDPLQRRHQGALVCQDWPGPVRGRGPLREDMYFSADDVRDDADFTGLIAFHLACYGGGTPKRDAFAGIAGIAETGAPQPFVAALPQRLLGHPRGGALAVVAPAERRWGCSFPSSRAFSESTVFANALKRLLTGHPIGSALDVFSTRYAELATNLSVELEEISFGRKFSPLDMASMWTANNDARSYILLGDPAVRLDNLT